MNNGDASPLGAPAREGDSISLEADRPLVLLTPNLRWHWIGYSFVVVLTLFFIIGVILPVLKTGDYASVWPASDKRIGKKISLFYMAWGWIICLPYLMRALNWKK